MGGEYLGRYPPGQTPPQVDIPPLDRHPPGQTPLRQTPPQADTPWGDTPLFRHSLGRHPPGQTPPGRHHPGQTPPCTVHAGIRSTSGRYASYWNAILFFVVLERKQIRNRISRTFNCQSLLDFSSLLMKILINTRYK